ncbi:MAG: hypothetical protein KatS3mg060_2786 [Dehalococcoidia bacterium]|nr:MAG: hypothetical protein KatS3mg060_2786 [Dehalococcoidia bacterium]
MSALRELIDRLLGALLPTAPIPVPIRPSKKESRR